ncbi:trichohyalin-like [Microplitis demolitor]|uniref:trichohyalin-like n=1 Tax=Microplitis demolitor TaxID=69319 RepID=UPI00235B5C40|nr:trichohyalin-like [Microplitis demolitor]
MREWSLENEVERFVSEARKRQDKKDKTNEEWRRQEKEKLIEEKPKKINGNELEEELKERKQKRLKIGEEWRVGTERDTEAKEKEDQNKGREQENRRKIMFWNVAGMNEVEKAATMMEENEIVVLVETWVMEDKVEVTCERLSKEFKWWAKPATREKQRGRAKGGHIIGIKKNSKLKWEVREWKYGMMLEESKESESIITVYNNVGMSKLETELRRQIEECANRDESVMIIGDFNARIGEENVTGEDEGRVRKKRKSRDKTVNSEGKKLLKIGDEQEIEVRVVERIESDHLPVLARYKEYAEATQEALTEAVEEKSELEWEDIKEIVRKGAEKTGMVMKGKKDKDTKEKKKWYNIEGKKKRKEVWKKFKEFIKDNNKEKKRNLKESRKKYRETIKESKERWMMERCEEISNAKDMTKWWEAINRFRGRKKRAASNSIKAKQWEKHFSDLLNGEGNEKSEEEENEPWKGEGSNEGSEEPKLDKNFSRREVKAAIRKLGNHKAPGEDGMAAEFIKNSAPDVIEWIGEIINRIWDEGSMPE